MSLCFVLTVGCIALGLTGLSYVIHEWQERRAYRRMMDERVKALRVR